MTRARIRQLVVVALTGIALLFTPSVVAPTESASAAGPRCPVPQRLQMEPIPAGTTPVVLVHGWTGKAENMATLGSALQQNHGDEIAVRYFDYWSDSVRWAAEPPIASCLAEYLHQASAQAGVPAVVVAHSMGGLAVRFAGSPDHVARPITADQVSEVVSIATPHRGSPWGGGMSSSLVELWKILESHGAMPPAGTADTCLALHDAGEGLAAECDVPPYLPAGINLLQIDGANTLHREIMGIRLYSIDQRGDGVVLEDSAGLYAGSAGQPTPTGYRLSNKTVSCDARTSEQKNALVRLLQSGEDHFVIAWIRTLTDGPTMDSILAGRLDALSGPQWGATALLSDCSHTRIADHPETAQHVTSSIERALTSRPRPDLGAVLAPAYCDQPERMVVNGHLDHGEGNGETQLALEAVHFWFPEEGTRVRVVEMSCTAGGVSWPGALLFFDDRGNRVGEVFTTAFDNDVWRGHTAVADAQPGDGSLRVTWFADHGAGETASGTGLISWEGGTLTVSSEEREIVVGSEGIGPATFGIPLDRAADLLTELFGPPDATPDGPMRDYAWGDLRITSLTEGSQTFENWSTSSPDLPPGAVFFGGAGPGSPAADARALFPGADEVGGPCGLMLFGEGITYCIFPGIDGSPETISFVQGGIPFIGE